MIIGIGGASRSGKTFLAKLLCDHLDNCINLHQDDFVYPEQELPKINNETDWESPATIDYNKLIATAKKASANYKHVVVEGFLVYANEQLLRLFDFKIFLAIDKNTFLARKEADDRWGKVSESYKAHIWKSYQKYGLISKEKADIVIDTRDLFNINIREIKTSLVNQL